MASIGSRNKFLRNKNRTQLNVHLDVSTVIMTPFQLQVHEKHSSFLIPTPPHCFLLDKKKKKTLDSCFVCIAFDWVTLQ